MNNSNPSGRVRSFDLARGIAIICIILGHYGLRNINRFVFTFHVPIFFLITGYFTIGKGSFADFTKKKFRTLIVPYYVTCAAIILFSVIFNELVLHWGNSREIALGWLKASLYGAGDSYTEPFPIKAIGAIWFLWATFWSSLFLRLSLKLKPAPRILFILALFVVGYWSRELFWFPLSIQAGCCATLFLYIGYLCREVSPRYQAFPSEVKAAWTVFALIVWFCFVRDFKGFWLVHCDIGRGIVDLFGSLCACYCVMLISGWLDRHGPKRITGFFSFLGENSIFMLCAHMFELDLVPWYVLQDRLYNAGSRPYVNITIIMLCKIIWAVAVTAVCANWNPTRRLFGLRAK